MKKNVGRNCGEGKATEQRGKPGERHHGSQRGGPFWKQSGEESKSQHSQVSQCLKAGK